MKDKGKTNMGCSNTTINTWKDQNDKHRNIDEGTNNQIYREGTTSKKITMETSYTIHNTKY